jgi:predicted adenine nucleotide alpha hydrolase (AANH) superfamily ATPase
MRIVLHICCGVCAAGAVKTLAEEEHQVMGFFYNPNIYPAAEYYKRLENASKVARELNFPLEAIPYAPEGWIKEAEPFQDEPEGGKRCPVCFCIRLEKTYLYLQKHKADAFTTTLTISPHKSAEIVNKIGREIGGDRFLSRDFKKKDGFKRAIYSAREWGLYQQNYCGCRYSIRQPAHSPIVGISDV